MVNVGVLRYSDYERKRPKGAKRKSQRIPEEKKDETLLMTVKGDSRKNLGKV